MLIIALLMVFAGVCCFGVAMRPFQDEALSFWMMIAMTFFWIFSIIPLSMIGK